MAVSDGPDREWTLGLLRRPANVSDGRPGDGGTEEYELICRDCGDDPRLGYREVPAELQRVRGPYRLEAGIEAFLAHCTSHEPAAGEPRRSLAGQPSGLYARAVPLSQRRC